MKGSAVAAAALGMPGQGARWIDGVMGARIDGRYHVVKRLAAGGMATLYVARDLALGREVAIKIGHEQGTPEETERFLREGKLMARLDHPFIARVYGLGALPGGRPYLIVELLLGTTLQDLARDAWIAPARVIARLFEIASALDWIHERGIVHRDVKLENLMLLAPGSALEAAKVFDFGIAIERRGRKERLERHGSIVGTPLYLAPEILKEGRCGPKSDVYALGVVAYQLLAGASPFDAPTFLELLRMKLEQRPRAPSWHRPGLPAAVDEVVARVLARRPSERHRSATEFVLELSSAFGLPSPAPSAGARSPEEDRTRAER